MNDLVADMLTRIQNAIMRRKDEASVINTKMNESILKVVKEEGMIDEYTVNDKDIIVKLAYNEKEPVITRLQKVSKSGQRIYVTKKEIVPIMNGRGISIISTSKGVMTGSAAKGQDLGGEFICKIW